MAQPHILDEVDNRGVAWITLNRPNKKNALSEAMVNRLRLLADRLAQDNFVRMLVLRANGSSFCAGGDLKWFLESVNDTRDGRIRRSAVLGNMLETLDKFPKPLIGAIGGNALGGGTGLVAVCDTALGIANARFGFPETRLGLIPATFLPYVLRRIGEARARAVMLSGAVFDGVKAGKIGLLDEVYPDHTALAAGLNEVIEQHLAASDEAMAMTKEMIARTAHLEFADAATWAAQRVGDAWENSDVDERIAAIFGKSR